MRTRPGMSGEPAEIDYVRADICMKYMADQMEAYDEIREQLDMAMEDAMDRNLLA